MQTLAGGFDAVSERAGSAQGDTNVIILVPGVGTSVLTCGAARVLSANSDTNLDSCRMYMTSTPFLSALGLSTRGVSRRKLLGVATEVELLNVTSSRFCGCNLIVGHKP
jgi:hypothetical protein